MKTEFAFGRDGLTVELPDGPRYEVIESRSARALPDAAAALEAALDAPLGTPPLQQLARGRRSAAISVCDITRPAPNATTLPPVLRRLEAAGIPREGITILIATGLHRGATAEETRAIVGPEIAATYRVVNHDARALAEHRALGSTRRGTPVYIDERFMAAELHLTFGFIEQHLMLGFSGGRKLIAPGLAAQETIKVIHSPRFMREATATEGSYEGNPLHEELTEIAAMARHDFALDVTLTRERAISGVFAGEPVAAHQAGVDFLRTTSLERVSGLADAVITSSAGHPLDLTFYQTVKGITAAQHLAKPGAPILLVGECREGIGSPEFAEMLRTYRSAPEFLAGLLQQPVQVDQWQMEKLALASQRNPLCFYTPGAPQQAMGSFGRHAFAHLPDAVAYVLRGLAPGARVALVPEGPYVFARVQS
ncbi:MAG: nickel-dependent lactate racemase [Acidobacteriota bacterium]|nr:nickel-dependent lactate racemase [Acidobacteriota bacterium]